MTQLIRRSSLEDLDTHVLHRVAMFKDMDYGDDAGRERMAPVFRELLRTWLTTGQARGWIAEEGGAVLGGALLQLKEALPSPLSLQRVRGYLYNVYVSPEARGKGLARRLTEAALAHAKAIGVEMVELHASKDAERLYRHMGFEPSPEFRLILSDAVTPPAQWQGRR